MRVATGIAVTLMLSSSLATAAAPSADSLALARKFGALETVQQMSMAPDGNRVAFVGNSSDSQIVYIVDLVAGGQPKPVGAVKTSDGRISWCYWASTKRIVCNVGVTVDNAGTLLPYSRLLSIDTDGGGSISLTPRTSWRALGNMYFGGGVIDWNPPGRPGSVLMVRDYIPEMDMGTIIKKQDEGFGVEEIDVATLRRRSIESPRRDAVHYISDGQGNVRVMGTQQTAGSGYTRTTVNYFYRLASSRDWKPLSSFDASVEYANGFEPYAVDRTRNAVFGFDQHGKTRALVAIALDGSNRREVVLSRPEVDVDGLIRIGREHRVVGASYATERRVAEYFDPDLKKLVTALGKALPGQPSVDVVDASDGESKLLIAVSSDTQPGVYYSFDKATRKLEELLPIRGDLAGITLAAMKPITFAAADGTQIPGYLTLPPGSSGKNLPAIVMPHGGPSSRDELGFDWLVQFFAARGFAVLQPNFRGSAGYGSDWLQKNGFQSWRTAIGDVNDAGRWLVKQGIAASGKLAIVGWSYGGYAALQGAVVDPDLYKAVVAVAPVTDLQRLRENATGWSNYRFVDKFIGTGPHVKEGSPAQHASAIRAPVLIFHGTYDRNVSDGQSKLMVENLRNAGKQVTYVEFPGLSHSLQDGAARTRLLSESDAFLRTAMGIAP